MTHAFPTRRSSDLLTEHPHLARRGEKPVNPSGLVRGLFRGAGGRNVTRYTPLLLLGRSRVCAGNGQGRIAAAPRGELFAAARFAVRILAAGSYRFWELGVPWPSAMEHVGCYSGVSVELRSEEQTSELQSLMRISYAVFCLKK